MLFLFAIAAPVLLVGAMFSKARQAAADKDLAVQHELLDQLIRAQITERDREYHIVVAIDAPTSIDFPLSLTLCDSNGSTGHFCLVRDDIVTEDQSRA